MTDRQMSETREMLLSFFQERAGECVHYLDAVDWATSEWKRRHDTRQPDFGREVRKMGTDGVLDRCERRGEYKYSGSEPADEQ